jgi:hypothetical protein
MTPHRINISKRHGVSKRTLKLKLDAKVTVHGVPTAQSVEWTGHKDAAVLFDPISPFDKRYYDLRTAKPAQVRANVVAGRYKYVVAVWDGKKVWIDDPDIIVEY